jgi:hypothetical protein
MRVEYISAFYMGIPIAIIIKYMHASLHNTRFPGEPYPTGDLTLVMAITSFVLSAIGALVFTWFKYSTLNLWLIVSHTFSFFTYLFPSLCLIGIIFHVYDNNDFYCK